MTIVKKQQAVIAEARTWLKTPYHSGARLKGIGVDCGQFLIGVYENAGIIQPGECNPGYYPHEIHLHRSEERYLEWILKYCDPVENPLPADIAMFKFGKSSSHSAIIIEWPQVIHAYVRFGVIASDAGEALLCNDDGSSRLTGFYRPKLLMAKVRAKGA
jgi:cell wall-associated NlpC family hydrolase